MPIEQCLGRPLTDFLTAEDETMLHEAFRSVIDTGQQSRSLESSLRTVDRAPRWVVIRLWPSIPAPGSDGVTGAMVDVTDLRRAERMKREFTARVSHELRTPLTVIDSVVSLMVSGAAGPMSESAIRLLSNAKKNSKRLLVLIDDLLDMEKLLAGKLSFSFCDMEMRSLLEQALSEHQPFADAHGVRLRLEVCDEQLRVYTDPDRFQ